MTDLVGWVLVGQGKKVVVETCGQPRVVWMFDYFKFSRMDITRIVINLDPVKHLPPIWMLYKHVGKVVRFNIETVNPLETHEPASYKRFAPWCLYDYEVPR